MHGLSKYLDQRLREALVEERSDMLADSRFSRSYRRRQSLEYADRTMPILRRALERAGLVLAERRG